MQIQLKDDMVVVEGKKKETDLLLVQVGQESAIADEQAELGAIEAEKVGKIQAEVMEFETSAKADLAAAEPAIQKAADALNSLDKGSLTELKSMATPNPAVLSVVNAVQYMMAKKGEKVKPAWAEAKKMMASVDKFLTDLVNFDKDNLPLDNKAKVPPAHLEPIAARWEGRGGAPSRGAEQSTLHRSPTVPPPPLAHPEVRSFTGPAEAPNPEFNPTYIRKISLAAAGLCDWVVNVLIYHDIFLDVEPKRKLLIEAQVKLEDANKKLVSVNEKVAALEARKQQFQDQLVEATEEKNRLIDKADQTAKRLNLAERLVNGLKDENERWGFNVERLEQDKVRRRPRRPDGPAAPLMWHAPALGWARIPPSGGTHTARSY
eukprot:11292-Prymnesium_polylepis.1